MRGQYKSAPGGWMPALFQDQSAFAFSLLTAVAETRLYLSNLPLHTQPPQPLPDETKLVRGLTLQDSILLLAGGVIGSGIFLTASDIALNTHTPALFLSIWVIGMALTMLACFAFAEMGAMFPQAGGQYVYLREAYGDFVAFLYGWMIFTVSVAGTIAALGAGFAEYAGKIFPALDAGHPVMKVYEFTLPHWHKVVKLVLTRGHAVAMAAIVIQTVVNIMGVRRGAVLQNIATWAKFIAIGAFVVLGLAVGRGSWSHYSTPLPASQNAPSFLAGIGVALIAVFWAYDGWVYIRSEEHTSELQSHSDLVC